jgi:RimJ/RimL family protein N-acetyltransferase
VVATLGDSLPRGFVVPTLVGQYVRLEPLSDDHVGPLLDAASEGRATYGYTPVPGDGESMARHVDVLCRDADAGLVVPFTQIDASNGRVLGMTRFMTIRTISGRSTPYAVEIGGTWLAASAQRTRVNTEAKLLLLRYAFDVWSVSRVDLKTDRRNDRSRAAISRLGATFEGILRHWQPSVAEGEEGLFRDTAMFSIIDDEWPKVASRLETLLR